MGFSGGVIPLAVPGEQMGQGWMVVMVVELGGRGYSLETGARMWDV